MAKRLKAVRAWASYEDGKLKEFFSPRYYRDRRHAQYFAGFRKVDDVVIITLAEYRAMRAAVRVAEAYLRGGKLNNAIYAYDRLVMAKKAKARTK